MVELRRIHPEAGRAILAGEFPPDVEFAEGYPTEFSLGVAASAVEAPSFGPFFIHRDEDGVVVGEIGGAVVDEGTMEIGYAVVEPLWGRGYATAAVQEIARKARDAKDCERVIAHAPLDRPQSGRVLEKAGFTATGEIDDEHEGESVRVMRWELQLSPG